MTVTAPDDRLDTPVQIRVAGLEPHERVALVARTRDGAGHVWTSTTPMRADGDGRLGPGTHPMRFLEAMRSRDARFFLLPERLEVDVEVRDGDDRLVGATIEREILPTGVSLRRLTVASDGRAGTYFAPRGGRHPAVLLLGGSEGGDSMQDLGALLAAHGLTVLTLAYFDAPGRPAHLKRIPLEYFRDAAGWLRAQSAVDRRRVAIAGDSRGGEAALLVAATYPRLFWRAAGLVPSAFVNGSPDSSATPAWTRGGRPAPVGERIPVERIPGPVLTLGAGEDALWSSAWFGEMVAEHRHDPHDVRLVYPDAGHSTGAPVPFVPEPWASDLGGTARADADARADAFPRLVRFLSASSTPGG